MERSETSAPQSGLQQTRFFPWEGRWSDLQDYGPFQSPETQPAVHPDPGRHDRRRKSPSPVRFQRLPGSVLPPLRLGEYQLAAWSNSLGGFDHILPADRTQTTVNYQCGFFAHNDSDIRDQENPAVGYDPDIFSNFTRKTSIDQRGRVSSGSRICVGPRPLLVT
jgi:hypothetical protein